MMKKLNSAVAFYVIVPQHQSCHLEHGPPGQAEDYKKGGRHISKHRGNKTSNVGSIFRLSNVQRHKQAFFYRSRSTLDESAHLSLCVPMHEALGTQHLSCLKGAKVNKQTQVFIVSFSPITEICLTKTIEKNYNW